MYNTNNIKNRNNIVNNSRNSDSENRNINISVPEQGCTRFMYLNRLQGELTLLL